MNNNFSRAAELIAGANMLVIGAGAGMGVDSGLPDFRGNEGFWQAYPALARAQLNFTEVASPRTFARDSALAWGFYGHRLALYRQTVPHAGFAILRQWQQRMALGATVFTSNVDGQFQTAGFAAEHIYECHGSIHHLQCMEGCTPDVWPAADFTPEVDSATCKLLNAPPLCPHCGALARPNVLMFGDWGFSDMRSETQRRRQQEWLALMAQLASRAVIVELGAGTAIPSVRSFCERISREFGAGLIRINPREPEVASRRDVGLACGAMAGLQGIDALLTA